MAGRTMPTGCPHGKDVDYCLDCRYGRETRNLTRAYPAEAVAQLVADGVLVEQKCSSCNGDGRARAWRPGVPCPSCKGSGTDGSYRLVLPDGEETSDE